MRILSGTHIVVDHPWVSIANGLARDIGALLDHIATNMKEEIDASRVAVAGGSCMRPILCLDLVHHSRLTTMLQMADTWSSYVLSTMLCLSILSPDDRHAWFTSRRN